MKGDISRDSYRSIKRYNGVRLQQGRVQLDSDWNEAQDLQREHVESLGRVAIGDSGAPKTDPGFRITPLTKDGKARDLAISKGRYFVEGVAAVNLWANATYLNQPSYLQPERLALGQKWSAFVYLDVWTRTVDALEDPDVLEPALGGPDTATRTGSVWQVRLKRRTETNLSPEEEWAKLIGALRISLRVSSEQGEEGDELFYNGTDNQLIRVEVQECGNDGVLVKWAYDNGSRAATILSVSDDTREENPQGKVVTLGGMQSLDEYDLSKYGYAEIISSGIEGRQDPSVIVPINKVLNASKIALSPQPGQTLNISSDRLKGIQQDVADPRIVFWNGTIKVTFTNGTSGPLTLQSGTISESIALTFFQGQAEVGDYWTIPVRASAGRILWPVEEGHAAQAAPQGPDHRVTILAVISISEEGDVQITQDCWKSFPSLSDIDAKDVAYTSKASEYLNGCENVEEALIKLSDLPLRRVCSVSVGAEGIYKTLEEAFAVLANNGCMRICLLPGVHALLGDLVLNRKDVDLEIFGVAESSVIDLGPYQMIIQNARSVTLKDLVIESKLNFKSNSINSAILIAGCDQVEISSCRLACESRDGHSLLTIDDPTLLRIRENAIRIDNPAVPIRDLLKEVERFSQVLDIEMLHKNAVLSAGQTKFHNISKATIAEINIPQDAWYQEENQHLQMLTGAVATSMEAANQYVSREANEGLVNMVAEIKAAGLTAGPELPDAVKVAIAKGAGWLQSQAPGAAISVTIKDGYRVEIEENVIIGRVEINWQNPTKTVILRSKGSETLTPVPAGKMKEIERITAGEIFARPIGRIISITGNPPISSEIFSQTLSIRSNNIGNVVMNAPATRTDNHLRLVQFADNVQYDGWSKLVGDWITVLNNSFTSRTATYVDIDANNATVQGNIGCISSVPSIPTAGGMYLLLLTLGMVRLRGKAFRCIVTGNIGLLNLMDVSVLI